MDKQNAIRLESVDCDVYKKNEHVRLIGGRMDGWQMHIENAKQIYHLDLQIDETKLFQIDNRVLKLIDLNPNTSV